MKRQAVLLVFLTLVPGASVKAAEVDEEAAAVVKGNNTFAFELYAQLRGQKGNLLFSPYTISNALAMTYFGAAGRTADEMARTLHLALGNRLHSTYERVARELDGNGENRKCTLSVANSLWDQKGYHNRPLFEFLLKKCYQGELNTVDFRNDPEAARKAINNWGKKKTKNRIKELFPPKALDKNVRLVLASTASFKADWENEFSVKQTRRGDFFLAEKKKVRVPLMSQRAVLRLYQGRDYQVLMLPSSEDSFRMLVVLLRKADGLEKLEKSLSGKSMVRWGNASLREVEVTLPRFKIAGNFDLKKALSRMGMSTAFSRGKADFSGITASEKLYFNALAHSASVEVNERGIGRVLNDPSAMLAPKPRPHPPQDVTWQVLWDAEMVVAPKTVLSFPTIESTNIYRQATFRADRPFLFVILDTRRGQILFMGRVANPRR
jgi:serpin B